MWGRYMLSNILFSFKFWEEKIMTHDEIIEGLFIEYQRAENENMLIYF